MSEVIQGLAKSASVTTIEAPKPPINQEAISTTPSWQGIPMDLYRFLNIDLFDASDKHIEELNDVYKYAKSKSNGQPGDMIQKIEELKVRLGEPDFGMTRLSQLTNYIRINRSINDMMKQKRSMEKRWA